MPLKIGAGSATLAASTEPRPDVRLDHEPLGHSAESRAVASLDTRPLNRLSGRCNIRQRAGARNRIHAHAENGSPGPAPASPTASYRVYGLSPKPARLGSADLRREAAV
jgi:hypothetical protein